MAFSIFSTMYKVLLMDRLCYRMVKQLYTKLQPMARKTVFWPCWRLAVNPTSSQRYHYALYCLRSGALLYYNMHQCVNPRVRLELCHKLSFFIGQMQRSASSCKKRKQESGPSPFRV